ncbi:MAG: M14 family metallopeptidase [Parvularculaceae bacterium]
MMLHRMNGFPAALADAQLETIARVFAGPTLISVKGEETDPLFLSVLLHGNETSSFYVLKALAERYRAARPPRSLLIFVGNIRAAEAGRRFMDDEPDFNRIWRGGDGAHAAMAAEVTAIARDAGIFASIDIHNNTGDNPHYGCVNSLRAADLHLASMFARVGVFYVIPNSTQSIAFSQFCPAVTLECGKSGDREGVAKAISLVEETMRLKEFPAHPPPLDALQLYETVGRVVVNPARSFSFGGAEADLILAAGLEKMNFKDAAAGFVWARRLAKKDAISVVNEHGDDLTGEFFEAANGGLVLRRPVTPAMISDNERAIRQDCLCYLMTPVAA